MCHQTSRNSFCSDRSQGFYRHFIFPEKKIPDEMCIRDSINSLFKLGIDLSKESTVKMGVLQREVGTGQISIKKALQLIYEDVNHMFEKRDQNFLPVICLSLIHI